MPSGTKYRTEELDEHFSLPRVGAAMASRVARDTAKLSVSQVLFGRSSTHIVVGAPVELHSSMPVSKSRLNAV